MAIDPGGFTPPPVGRPSRLPQWSGAFSSITDYIARFRQAVVSGMVWSFASAAVAKTAMESDGAAPSPVFVVDTDPTGIYRFSGGTSFRIGREIELFIGIVSFSWTSGQAWSAPLLVPWGSAFAGNVPHGVFLQTLGQSGSAYDVRTKVMTAGDAYTPDVDGTRARVVAQASPTPTENMTRTAFLLAIRKV